MSYTNGLDKPSDYFNTITYSGNGSNPRTLTGVGFQPDWVWQKNRTDSNGHTLADAIRGANKTLSSDGSGAEVTDKNDGHLDAFTSDGFTVGAGSLSDARVNDGSHTYVAWNWLAGGTASSNTDGSITSTVSANTTAGFSIVSYTGTASAGATIGHGLGAVPSMYIIKNRSATEPWMVYHQSLGNTKALYLNTTNAELTSSVYTNNTSPTSSVLSLGNWEGNNGSGNSLIAYCFAEKKGYSKFGSYVGNGSSDGSYIHLGFKPAWVMTKISSGTGQWGIADNKRGVAPSGEFLFAESSEATNSAPNNFDFLSNGFKARADYSAMNTSGATYIYMALAENPFVTSTGIPCTAR